MLELKENEKGNHFPLYRIKLPRISKLHQSTRMITIVLLSFFFQKIKRYTHKELKTKCLFTAARRYNGINYI